MQSWNLTFWKGAKISWGSKIHNKKGWKRETWFLTYLGAPVVGRETSKASTNAPYVGRTSSDLNNALQVTNSRKLGVWPSHSTAITIPHGQPKAEMTVDRFALAPWFLRYPSMLSSSTSCVSSYTDSTQVRLESWDRQKFMEFKTEWMHRKTKQCIYGGQLLFRKL
jgi:hypothetical protein